MQTRAASEERQGDERQDRDRQEFRLGEAVLDALGRPAGLHKVQVRRLWPGHYRVNVFVGGDAVSARVAHSYFLAADGVTILASAPEIRKVYPEEAAAAPPYGSVP
jgi:hypothetical protein